MKYTQYIKTASVISLLSVTTIALAATGATTTSTGAVATGAVSTGATTTPVSISLEVKGAPRLVKKTSDSITLEWDKVAAASAYIVKYSKTSVANSKDPNAQYDNETDQVTQTGVTVTKLSTSNEKLAPASAYYFSVVAIDKEGKESDTFSDELMVMTEAASLTATPVTTSASGTGTAAAMVVPTAAALAIKELAVTDNMTLTLSFSSDLGTDPVKVKITKTSDNSDVGVGTITKDEKMTGTVKIATTGKLLASTSYTLTVLSAKGAAGATIQEGVSGTKEFTTPADLKASAAVAETMTATDASGATAATGALVPATTVETGAKENIIILAALLLSLGIVVVYRRKLV